MQNETYPMEDVIPVLTEVVESGGEFRVAPRGTSMWPLLREGRDAVALVAPKHLKKWDICLYRRADGSYVLHRLMRFKKGEPVFCGDNQTTMEYGVSREAVIAKVIAIYRDEKRVKLTDPLYQIYTNMHCIMLWRRWLFLPRRLFAFLKRKLKKSR